jgi:hypothetical protein
MSARTICSALASLLATALAGAALAPLAGAATITPTAATDDITNNGNCTLREAVQATNTNLPRDLCPAGSATAADEIILEAPVYLLTVPGAGEINNLTGDLDVVPTGSSPLTIKSDILESEIDGSSGANTDRVIEKSTGSGSSSLTLSRIRLDDGTPPAGESGGALRVVGSTSVTLNNSRVTNSDTDSRGGGMLVVDDLTLNNSTVSGNASTETGGNIGGGIFSDGDVTINRSTITLNQVNSPDDANEDEVRGGGIAAPVGSLTIVDSTIGGNTINAADSGDTALGAGIYAKDIPVTITGSTITSNLVTGVPFARLGGGLFYRDPAPLQGPLEIENSTFEGNLGGGGGLEFGGALRIAGGVAKIASSTFTVNNAATGRAIEYDDFGDASSSVTVRGSIFDENSPACSGPDPIDSAGFNIDKGTSCGFTGPGDVSSTDPNVGDLDDNGGPTLTGDLPSSSPAIDRIPLANCVDVDGAPLALDQRGAPRGFDEDGDSVAECDMGSYELNRCLGEIVNVVGTPSNDTLVGTAGDDVISGGGGGDVINGGGGSDLICGDDGKDTFIEGSAANGSDTFNGGADTDEVTYSTRTAAVTATINNVANDGAAGEGDNVMRNVENLVGGLAGDTVTGSASANTLNGGGGDDTLTGSGGIDTLNGFAGDDTFGEGGAANGADTFNGGDDTDTVSYGSRTAAVTATINDVANDGAAGEGDNVKTTVENLTGGSAGDRLAGSGSANTLTGGGGGDTLTGRGGGDILSGLAGDDTFGEGAGANGADTFSGGGDTDTVNYGGRTTAVTVTINDAANDGAAGEGDNVRTGVENVTGGSAGDSLTSGSSSANTLFGQGGPDTLNVVDGISGNDTADGGTDTDTCTADAGDIQIDCP